jgi:serine phosphatase RsbU (regulator of sigma subunit)
LVRERMTIGRSPEATVCLPSDTVSRFHAELFCDPFGRWWIHDLKSHNGTRVNGARVGEAVLRSGDVVEVGQFTLRLRQPNAGADTIWTTTQDTVAVSDAGTGTITTLSQGAVPKIAASHLSMLLEFGRQLMSIEQADERLRGLCGLLVSPTFNGMAAVAMRLSKDRPDDPPEMLCQPQARPDHQNWKPYVSKRVIEMIRFRNEPVLASNAVQGPVDVELSMAAEVMALSAMACPLRSDDRTLDLVYVVLPPEYGTREWLALASLAVAEFQKVEFSWAARRQAQANALIERELEQARQIQMRLIPQEVKVAGLDVAIGFEPCRCVAGDYVDVVAMPDGRTLLTVADVCGKGLHAALVAATVHSLVHAGLRTGAGLADLMQNLNEYLCEYLPENSFVTMVTAVVDPRTGEIECVNAGHPAAMIFDPGGEVRQLQSAANLPLGLAARPVQVQRERIASGQLLAMFTDGLTDLEDPTGRKVGVPQLEAHLRSVYASAAGLSAGQVADRLKGFLQEVLAGSLPADDCTFLLARRMP